jgi:hypothetical protein
MYYFKLNSEYFRQFWYYLTMANKRGVAKNAQILWDPEGLEDNRKNKRQYRGAVRGSIRGKLVREPGIAWNEGLDAATTAARDRCLTIDDIIINASDAKTSPKYRKPPAVSDKTYEILALKLGSAYSTRTSLDKAYRDDHPLPFLETCIYDEGVTVPKGKILLYIGSYESMELTGKTVAGGVQKIGVERHVFLSGTTRYIVEDLNAVQPL